MWCTNISTLSTGASHFSRSSFLLRPQFPSVSQLGSLDSTFVLSLCLLLRDGSFLPKNGIATNFRCWMKSPGSQLFSLKITRKSGIMVTHSCILLKRGRSKKETHTYTHTRKKKKTSRQIAVVPELSAFLGGLPLQSPRFGVTVPGSEWSRCNLPRKHGTPGHLVELAYIGNSFYVVVLKSISQIGSFPQGSGWK